MTDEKLVDCKKPEKLPKLIFTLALFHSVTQERKKFGEIGFNKRYDFNITDFDSSIQLIKSYINQLDPDYEDLPWEDIRYLIGDINYGGRITDDFDKITMQATLEKFFCDNLFENSYLSFTTSNKYSVSAYTTVEDYRKLIDTFPVNDEPEIFGLNSQAEIIYQLQESNYLNQNLLTTMPRISGKSGMSDTEVVLKKLEELSFRRPERIDPRDSRNKIHDKTYDNGLNHSFTILMDQEIEKYNNLITKIRLTLENLKLAIDGIITMSNESDELFMSILNNKVPLSWEKVGYSSSKPLSSWINDLTSRVDYIRTWVTNGHPVCHWISGLFYPRGFITSVLQNHARETKIPVSEIKFDFSVLNCAQEDLIRLGIKAPSVGVYINGLYIEAASWDINNSLLIEQEMGEVNSAFKMPVIWLKTKKEEKYKEEDDEDEDDENKIYKYDCPVFKTNKRTSVISSSGRSEDYILTIVSP